ncbi:MAG: ABC transporter permease [Nitrospinota bacterium]
MRNIAAIFRRELMTYFYSPIAYGVIAIFLIITGFLFYSVFAYFSLVSLRAAQSPAFAQQLNITAFVIEPIVRDMSWWGLFIVPFLTMRLFAEERRLGTAELLFTYPVRDSEVVLGKFLACLAVYGIALGLTGLYPAVVALFGEPEVGPIISGYLGLFLAGVAYVAFGTFISSLTRHQILAVALSIGFLLLLWVVAWGEFFAGPFLGQVLKHVSLRSHLWEFSKGVIDTKGIIYFLNFSAFFLFLTMRSLEGQKWRG